MVVAEALQCSQLEVGSCLSCFDPERIYIAHENVVYTRMQCYQGQVRMQLTHNKSITLPYALKAHGLLSPAVSPADKGLVSILPSNSIFTNLTKCQILS